MGNLIGRAYRDSARIARVLPWLFALPVAMELVQHAIEMRIGMLASTEAMQQLGGHAARMGFGQFKILSLVLVFYWVSRWQAFAGDRSRPLLGDRESARLFVGVVLLGIAIGLVQQFGGTVLAPLTGDGAILVALGFAFFLGAMLLDTCLAVWKVGAALGNPLLTIAASFRVMHGHVWWSLGFSIVMMMPLMIVHYALNGFAVGRPVGVQWALLAVDSLVVGYLGLVLATTVYLIAERAAARSGVPLAAREAPATA
jgi:hypothetical protein